MTQPRHSSMVFHEKALQIKSKALEKAFLKKIKVDIAPSTCPYKPIFLNIIVIVVHFFTLGFVMIVPGFSSLKQISILDFLVRLTFVPLLQTNIFSSVSIL